MNLCTSGHARSHNLFLSIPIVIILPGTKLGLTWEKGVNQWVGIGIKPGIRGCLMEE
ncbi:hypothetical protein MC7420_7776 [Coleofasciculus chthonoplastes PCC 7420]|uniref:Uncharacterized protein n=1 Tax=Coleofasciculus chthonoplastes PCC 7420 TaxID=118168 RepID=B4VIS2_9CYAN|nr:hypothetical protein MC7420_7776 [Coleofasciculus chthonoplastes PCC 7420]